MTTITITPARVVRLRALQLRELSMRLERTPWLPPKPKDAQIVGAAATLLEQFARHPSIKTTPV
jgi:hypothetical protein